MPGEGWGERGEKEKTTSKKALKVSIRSAPPPFSAARPSGATTCPELFFILPPFLLYTLCSLRAILEVGSCNPTMHAHSLKSESSRRLWQSQVRFGKSFPEYFGSPGKFSRILSERYMLFGNYLGRKKAPRKFQEAVNPNGCLGPTERGGWRGAGRKGWQRVGERLAKGWRRVGKGWRRVGKGLADFLAPSNFGIPEAPV